ncbi:MAG: enoyl-CoA hydratase [Deltaproteobacteria bacterium]|nr:enoyl-CoA hydratase [Deltaproteobacteria bacterium]
MAYQFILMEKANGIATMTLNRPEKLNALNMPMMDEMRAAFQDAVADEDVRLLVITGAGRGFCSGADTGGQAERAAMRAAGQRISKNRHDQVMPVPVSVDLHKIEKPTIAAVNGVAAGLGLSLVLACDMAIATDTAKFGALWVRRGLIPDGGATYFLPKLVGKVKSLEMMLTGDIVDAKEAERIGLVSRVVTADKLMPTVNELAGKIARGPAVALEITKRAVYKGMDSNLDSAVDFELWGQHVCYLTEDHKEAIAAFQGKRDPVFKGR